MQNHGNLKSIDWFLAPIMEALKGASHTRDCQKLSDLNFIQYCIMKVIMEGKSGRDFVQKMRMTFIGCHLSVSLFFKSLASGRRELLTREVASGVRGVVDAEILQTPGSDPLQQHPELNGFAIYATDGHTHAASAHEPFRFGKKYPVSHIFSINLRSETAIHQTLLFPEEDKKKEHEIKALKRLDIQSLRVSEPAGTKVIHVYDPAVIDYAQWQKWKQGSGIYIITREKSNSAFTQMGALAYDPQDVRNNGVLSDHKMETSGGITIRRIRYCDPATGITYSFITNEMNLPPGLVAFLYFLRWNVEKLFDEFKSALDEKKAWTGQPNGKIQQAQAMVMAHNLLLLAEHRIKAEHQIEDLKVQKKRSKALATAKEKAEKAGRPFNPLIETCQRATRRSMQFIRWVRHCLAPTTYLSDAIAMLRPLMIKYLI